MSIILHLCPCLNKANVGSNQMLTFVGRYVNPPLAHFFNRLGCSVPVHLPGVLLRVDGHSSNPQFGAGSEHADGDLTWGETIVYTELNKSLQVTILWCIFGMWG